MQTTLLYIVWELAGGGSVPVTVGISAMWQVTRNTRHMTLDMWNMNLDIWHMTRDSWHLTHDTWFSFFWEGGGILLYWCIGATIRTHQEIQCLPYAGFLYFGLKIILFIFCPAHHIYQRPKPLTKRLGLSNKKKMRVWKGVDFNKQVDLARRESASNVAKPSSNIQE